MALGILVDYSFLKLTASKVGGLNVTRTEFWCKASYFGSNHEWLESTRKALGQYIFGGSFRVVCYYLRRRGSSWGRWLVILE
jgi:hypothetical protein